MNRGGKFKFSDATETKRTRNRTWSLADYSFSKHFAEKRNQLCMASKLDAVPYVVTAL